MNLWLNTVPEAGLLALLLAAATGMMMALAPLVKTLGAARPSLLSSLSLMQFLACALAFICLEISLLSDDFSVAFVQANSQSALPTLYKVAALWGAHEGSLLLWLLLLSFWTLVAPADRGKETLPVRSVLGAIVFAFAVFTAFTSNPFARLLPMAPATGMDLNPLLQHPALAIHPPLLYAGYTGTALIFAIALSTLGGNTCGKAEIRQIYLRTLAPWGFLTAGVALGSWWAYQELGWGGWWFWDPVENLSLLPWLCAAALVHVSRSALASKAQGDSSGLRDLRFCLVLAVLSFPLAMLGAFMVRSGLLVSVHSFSSDPTRGIFLLLLLALISIPGLVALTRMPPGIRRGRATTSREALVLASALLLLLAALTLLLGILYPLLYELINGERAALGAPYFERVLAPLLLLGLIGITLAPLSRWQRPVAAPLRWQMWLFPGLCALATAVLLPFFHTQPFSFATLLPVPVVLALAWLLQQAWLSWRRQDGQAHVRMLAGHAGVLLVVTSISLQAVTGYQREILITPNEELQTPVGVLRFLGIQNVQAENYHAVQAHFQLTASNGGQTSLYPEKRTYFPRGQVLTEAAIERVGIGDLYLVLGQQEASGRWPLRVHYKPLMDLLWFGMALVAFAAIPIRRRKHKQLQEPMRTE